MRTTTFFQLIVIVLLIGALGFIIFTGPDDQEDRGFGGAVNYRIVGIEPGAGIMANTEQALEAYELEQWDLQQSSSAAMLTSLQQALENQEPIVATVWEPHSAFAIGELRKLDDPRNIYNDPEATRNFLEEHAPEYADAEVSSDVLATVTYQGFGQEAPAAYEFFRNFQIPADTQSQWIYEFNINDRPAEEVAAEYLEENQEQVTNWTDTDADQGRSELSLGLPPWPGATVKSQVVKQILEEMGYTVDLRELDAGIVYTSLAERDIDATVAGWLPTTHRSYWEETGEQLEIAGVNVTQTWLGLAVPEYVDESIQSLEDLKLEEE